MAVHALLEGTLFERVEFTCKSLMCKLYVHAQFVYIQDRKCLDTYIVVLDNPLRGEHKVKKTDKLSAFNANNVSGCPVIL